jgi:WhiB family redox-sensing transcriptional regulator
MSSMDSFAFFRPEWQKQAACRGMMRDETKPKFFIARTDGPGVLREARKVCDGCPVQQECLDFAIRFNISEGVWGGLSGRQRRNLRHDEGITGSEFDYSVELSHAALQAQKDKAKLSNRQLPT